jgi:hypothetical protein
MKLRTLGILLAVIVAGCSSDSGGGGSGGESGSAVDAGGSGGTGTGDAAAGGGGARDGAPSVMIGDPCTDAAQCVTYGGIPAVCMTAWPGGGYCTNEHCAGTLACGPGSDCKLYEGEQRCFHRCGTGCRAGYTCQNGVCLPAP